MKFELDISDIVDGFVLEPDEILVFYGVPYDEVAVISKTLKDKGLKNLVICLAKDQNVEILNEETMEMLGWVRRSKVQG